MPDFPAGTPWWGIVIVASVSAIASVLVAWVQTRSIKKDNAIGKADSDQRLDQIETQLKDSPTIKGIQGKLERDYGHFAKVDEHMRKQDASVREIKLMILRQNLFQPVTDRATHEYEIQSGEEYEDLGGNSIGHLRLEWLKRRYRWRQDHDDWDYTGNEQQQEKEEGK